MIASGHGVSIWGDEKILKLDDDICKKNEKILHFKTLNCIFKNNTQSFGIFFSKVFVKTSNWDKVKLRTEE